MNHEAVCGDDREIFVAIKEGSLDFERILYILRFSVVSKPSSQLFSANQIIRETTISRVKNTFRPITKNCQKYWVFALSPLPAPSVYLKLRFVVGFVNILKGVWICSQIYFLKDDPNLKFMISCVRK